MVEAVALFDRIVNAVEEDTDIGLLPVGTGTPCKVINEADVIVAAVEDEIK